MIVQRDGNYRIDKEATPTMLNSLMYKLSYYRFAEAAGGEGAIDRVRRTGVGKPFFKLTQFEEVFTTQHWMMRIYKLREPKNRPRGKAKRRTKPAVSPRCLSHKKMRGSLKAATRNTCADREVLFQTRVLITTRSNLLLLLMHGNALINIWRLGCPLSLINGWAICFRVGGRPMCIDPEVEVDTNVSASLQDVLWLQKYFAYCLCKDSESKIYVSYSGVIGSRDTKSTVPAPISTMWLVEAVCFV